jgi:hypothetical protein
MLVGCVLHGAELVGMVVAMFRFARDRRRCKRERDEDDSRETFHV